MSHIVIVAVPFVRLRPLYQRQNYMAQSAWQITFHKA
jgi:hypothetical protein